MRHRDYIVKIFGSSNFGIIYGTLVCISGIFSLVQSGLDALTHLAFHGNPVPVNIALAASGAIVSATLAAFMRTERNTPVAEERMRLGGGGRVPLTLSGSEYGTFE